MKEESDKWSKGMRNVIIGLFNQGLTQREIVSGRNNLNIKTRRDCSWTLITLQIVMKKPGVKTFK